MYHYTECGLRNVWLVNGYRIHDTSYGKGVSVENMDQLHRVIAMLLITRKPALTGAEFRFLRKELGLSQAKLASLIGNNAQSVALWEKRGRIPKWADRFIRAIYREYAEGNARIVETIEQLNDLDRAEKQPKLFFEETDHDWQPKAA
jgi:DNA-binding transcriptional regulator YiaG